MGRRPKYSRDGALTRPAAPAGAPADAAVPPTGLEGWPPAYYCPTCFSVRHSAQEIRDDYCDRCHAFLDALELAYKLAMSARPKALPEA